MSDVTADQGRQSTHGPPSRIFICSPYRADSPVDVHLNLNRALHAARYAALQNHIPVTPHLYFPQFLSDANDRERNLGLRYGWYELQSCSEVWVCGPRVSEGMQSEIDWANMHGIPVKMKAWGDVGC